MHAPDAPCFTAFGLCARISCTDDAKSLSGLRQMPDQHEDMVPPWEEFPTYERYTMSKGFYSSLNIDIQQ